MYRKFTIALLAILLSPLCTTAQPRPKLVVGITVDQMRWDYLYRFYDEYTDGGFRRMLNEGYTLEDCQINYVPTVTAVGHTSIFTGSTPAIHGIAGNNYLQNGKMGYCCQDTTVAPVGTNNKNVRCSPRLMLTTTIGDELKTATNWRSKVVGVSFKDRAAILPAGHQADAAYWFDDKTCHFVTSTYYMQELPKWVNKLNKQIKRISYDSIRYSPYGNQLTADMAKAVVENERLGQRGECDMLTVSFSCTDMVGHTFGTHSPKTHQQYIELDKQLADLFTYLDQKVGKGQWLAFLSADHGAANSVQQNLDHNIPAGEWYGGEEKNAIEKTLKEKFGNTENLVYRIFDYKVALDHEAIRRQGLDEQQVRDAVVAHFDWRHPHVMFAADMERLHLYTMPDFIRERIQNGYHRGRSGDIQLVMRPGHFDTWRGIGYGTTHGIWAPYDNHIPFVLMGWGVPHGSSAAECHITDIAATVCSLIHVQMPSGCIGHAVKLE